MFLMLFIWLITPAGMESQRSHGPRLGLLPLISVVSPSPTDKRSTIDIS